MKASTLIPVNGRKSFYGKCQMIKFEDVTYLQSYGTQVACYNHTENKMYVYGWYSNTTASHINSFLAYFNLPLCNKKQMEEYNK